MGADRIRLGDALVKEGVLSEDQLKAALQEQQASGRMLGELLVEQGVLSGSVAVRTLARQLGVKGCMLRHGLIDPDRTGGGRAP